MRPEILSLSKLDDTEGGYQASMILGFLEEMQATLLSRRSELLARLQNLPNSSEEANGSGSRSLQKQIFKQTTPATPESF